MFCLTTHLRITYIHVSKWNIDTVSFNLDLKYLHFEMTIKSERYYPIES